jgi:uncharacterized protein (DUF2147 family)
MPAPKKLHPADVWTRANIARATRFTAVFTRSPKDGGNVIVQAVTLAAAFTAADALNAAHGRWGRRAGVYAIDPEGMTHFVDPELRPGTEA